MNRFLSPTDTREKIALSLAFLLGLLGCSTPPPATQSPDAPLLIRIGAEHGQSEEHHLDEFQFFVTEVYPELEGTIEDELHSRLFDRFEREVILSYIARRTGFHVSDDQIDAFIQNQMTTVSFHLMNAEEQTQWRRAIRRRQRVQQFLQRKLLREVNIDEDAIHAYYGDNEDEFKREPMYRIRVLPIEDEAVAKTIQNTLRRTRKPFIEVAQAHLEDADQLMPVTVPLKNLAEPFQNAVRRLRPGRHSKTIPLKEGEITVYYILYLEAAIPAATQSFDEAYHDIRKTLERRAIEAQLETVLEEWRARLHIEVFRNNLTFTYQEPSLRSTPQ
ncbi:peptidyl-prolyl cis-trans isomerase [Acanthopleuribacter pedis]|uniref:peptidylprolyl isomerase n=1 Tax=Acanthopleuribacter pedis TaxID=442870 RepID=A0A8J7QLH7_9BACT|nr:peptidylprolyl isomerase [Acanthopleuribacter pedis]MBO1322010.1 peptidyl-prolyl cis-trans isomerase [Acanthopleuribacter pedis]